VSDNLRREHDEGRLRLHRSMWADLPPQPVQLSTLHPTQWPHYDPCQLCTLRLGRPVEGGDPYPHLADWRGRRWIWDGHTRIARALRDGQPTITARVLRVG
jgi:hypothetical protein